MLAEKLDNFHKAIGDLNRCAVLYVPCWVYIIGLIIAGLSIGALIGFKFYHEHKAQTTSRQNTLIQLYKTAIEQLSAKEMSKEDISNGKNITVFIDISGSVYPVFPEIKQAVLEEIFSDIEIGTTLTIYKFYRKIVPIYEGTLKRNFDIEYAKSRVMALKANGPWADIQKVFTYIQEHQSENTRYFIFTDGKHETEDRNYPLWNTLHNA